MNKKINTKQIFSFFCILTLMITFFTGITAKGNEAFNSNCLKVVTGVNQWEGVNISAENLNLVPNNKYHFSVDIYTPDFEVGIIFQISGGGWNLVFTENFDKPEDKGWRTLEGDMDFSDTSLLNENGELNFNEFQLTKTGDKNTDKKVTFYIDNFTVTNITNDGETVFFEDFESLTHAFRANSSQISIVASTSEKENTGFDPTLPSLKDVYKDYFMLGNIVNPNEIDTTHYDLLKHHFNTLTFENSMKPDAMWGDSVYPNTPSFWIDEHIKKVIDDGFTLIGHTLAWHGQSPNWLNVAEGSRDKKDVVYKTYEEAKANLKLFISTVAGRYYNNADGLNVYSWDVLNEAIDYWGSDPVPSVITWQQKATGAVGWLSPLYGAYQNGHEDAPWDYIYDVFLFAREADPNAILYYNDYNMQNAGKATLVMNMVNDINARYAEEYPEANGRLLIEGIGMQEHQDIKTKVSDVEASIKKFISTGAKISITELDIGIPDKTKKDTLTKEEEINQAICYANMFKLFMEYSDYIERVSFWGVDDQTSWRNDLVCIFNGDLSAKEAFYAVLDPEAYLLEHDPKYVSTDSNTNEDDSTIKEDESEEVNPIPTTAPTTAPTTVVSPTEAEVENVDVSALEDTNDGINPIIIVIIVIVVSIIAGVVVFIIKHKKKD